MFDSLIQSNLDFINRIKIHRFWKLFIQYVLGIILLICIAGVTLSLLETKEEAKSLPTGSLEQKAISTKESFVDKVFKGIISGIKFLGNNYKDIFYVIFIITIVSIIIEPPIDEKEFMKRLYGEILQQLKTDNYKSLSERISVITNKQGTWIKFLIKGITERIHFEIYVMEFGKEQENSFAPNFINQVDRKTAVYFQYALHVENLSENDLGIENTIRKELAPIMQAYNILPNVWSMKSILSDLAEKDKFYNISYSLLSTVNKKHLLLDSEDSFYISDLVRRRLFFLFSMPEQFKYKHAILSSFGNPFRFNLKSKSLADIQSFVFAEFPAHQMSVKVDLKNGKKDGIKRSFNDEYIDFAKDFYQTKENEEKLGKILEYLKSKKILTGKTNYSLTLRGRMVAFLENITCYFASTPESFLGDRHYTKLADLSKADVKLIGNTFIEQMNYFFQKKSFFNTLVTISKTTYGICDCATVSKGSTTVDRKSKQV